MVQAKAIVVVLLMVLAGCASAPRISKEDVRHAIKAAEQVQAQAVQKRVSWLYTEDVIAAAHTALQLEDLATALREANKARHQAENALLQYKSSLSAAGPRF